MPAPDDQIKRLEDLLDVGRSLTAELNLDTLLDSVLTTARALTGARFAAIGVLDERRRSLEQFLTSGLPPEAHDAIGQLPHGRGILGLLIDDPQPLLVSDITTDPRAAGFPANHPPMRGFLGVPIRIRGEAWGNLYLTERSTGENFNEADVETVQILAQWAAVAIENARLFAQGEERRGALERANEGLEATIDVALAIGDATDLDRILQLIATRARAVVRAGSVVLLTSEGDDVRVAARDDAVPRPPAHEAGGPGPVLPHAMTAGDGTLTPAEAESLQLEPGRATLVEPLGYRGESLGVLVASAPREGRGTFTEDDERALRSLAASASTAITTARSVATGRLRATLAAAEAERKRWARELHDETLQGLGALRLVLRGALRTDDPERRAELVEGAIDQLDLDIAGLRAIIHDLRPAVLDDLGLAAAVRALAQRTAERTGITADTQVSLGDERLDMEIETAAYRIVQEALTNVVKHAAATTLTVELHCEAGALHVRVADDGIGVDRAPQSTDGGLGITGMRERAQLVGGDLTVRPLHPGTEVVVRLPLSAA